jgi:osmotically-inducible protein OsmY
MLPNKITRIAVSLLLAFGISACDKPGTVEQAGKKVDQTFDKFENKLTEQGAKSAQVFDDAEITTRVKAEYLGEPGLKSMQIRVDTVNGVVTLTGTVDSKSNSEKAEALAKAISGVKEVNNQLITLPAGQS